MVLLMTRAGKVTTAVLVVFTVAMNPPVIELVGAPTLVAGMASLYAWTVAWGIFISLVLVLAAYRDAFALTEAQVPPELRRSEDVTTTRPDSGDPAAEGGN